MFTGDLNFALDVAKSLTQPLSGVGGRAGAAGWAGRNYYCTIAASVLSVKIIVCALDNRFICVTLTVFINKYINRIFAQNLSENLSKAV